MQLRAYLQNSRLTNCHFYSYFKNTNLNFVVLLYAKVHEEITTTASASIDLLFQHWSINATGRPVWRDL